MRFGKYYYFCELKKRKTMLSASVENMIPLIQMELANQPVTKAWLFGSCSRGEETDTSDVDILVQYDESARISLFTISRIMCALKQAINRDVDLVEEGRLLPFAEDSANHDKILIYEREN